MAGFWRAAWPDLHTDAREHRGGNLCARRFAHHVSVEQLCRYVNEATVRLNEGNVKIHTVKRLEAFVELAFRVRITYRQLVEGNA